MAKDRYTYPAIFDYADDGISVSFPDFPGCFTCAHSDEEALKMAEEALGLRLAVMEQDREDTPDPTPARNVETEPNQRVMLVQVYMPSIRPNVKRASVKKTLTIPAWLNIAAEEQKVNFSQTLQEALKDRLGLGHPT
jgi:predicted RNase H-like HicB family nuclease